MNPGQIKLQELMGVLYLTGEEWLRDISREQERCAVPTELSGFLQRTRIHQLHNGVLEAAPLNQSPRIRQDFIHHVHVKITSARPAANGDVCNKCGSRRRRRRYYGSRPIRSEGNG